MIHHFGAQAIPSDDEAHLANGYKHIISRMPDMKRPGDVT